MKDIAIFGNNLLFENGDLKLADGKERVIQQILVGLKILKGDWYLDYRAGIDYINGLKAYPKILNSEIKKAILEVLGVDSVRDYKFKRVGDKYHIEATTLINNQTYKISEVFKL